MKLFTFYSTFDTLSNTIIFFANSTKKKQKIKYFCICEILCALFFTNKDSSRMKRKVFHHYAIYVPHK